MCGAPVGIIEKNDIAGLEVLFADVLHALAYRMVVGAEEEGQARSLGDQLELTTVDRDTKVENFVDDGVECRSNEGVPHLPGSREQIAPNHFDGGPIQVLHGAPPPEASAGRASVRITSCP